MLGYPQLWKAASDNGEIGTIISVANPRINKKGFLAPIYGNLGGFLYIIPI
jgi:hypothetical protein